MTFEATAVVAPSEYCISTQTLTHWVLPPEGRHFVAVADSQPIRKELAAPKATDDLTIGHEFIDPAIGQTSVSTKSKKVVLDTNVLLHDPTAIFRFADHDVHLPIVVLEELDSEKRGISEIAQNAREASRRLDDLLTHAGESMREGIMLGSNSTAGRLYIHIDSIRATLPAGLSPSTPDNAILGTTLDLAHDHPDANVTLVTKDVILRIKAHALGIQSRDYVEHELIDDTNHLYPGIQRPDSVEHDALTTPIDSWMDDAGVGYRRVRGCPSLDIHPNEFIVAEAEPDAGLNVTRDLAHPFTAVVKRMEVDGVILRDIRDFSATGNTVWGTAAMNMEQNFALNLLMDPEVDFVTILGQAGTGKTLLALAAGLAQTIDEKRYQEIIVTRITVPVGEDIGYLPGTEEEKMNPWMGALEDNLDVLLPNAAQHQGAWGRAVTHDLVRNRIRIKSLNFMRGRTFLDKYIIIDEAQNLTPHQLKTLITRAGKGSKVVCLGNLAQIDTPYLTGTTSGLTYVVERFKHWQHSGHVTLRRVERSRLADYAAELL